MKALQTFIVLVLTTLATFITSSTAFAESHGKAIVDFSGKVHDFGSIREDGGPVTCEFEFSNSGDSNLVIVSAKAQCGCTRPEFPQKPIAPGKKGKIKVTYAPLGRPGAFEKTITVVTNGKPKKVALKIRGTVIPK